MVGGVLRCGSQVVLCRRRAGRVSYPNVWDLPGGHVEPGEDNAAALVRECREKLGVEVVTSFAVALAEPTPGSYLSVRLITGWRGQPRNAAPEERSEIGWFTGDELGALRFPPCALNLSKGSLSLSKGSPNLSTQAHPYVPLLTDLLQPSPKIEIRRLNTESVESVGALHALSRQETYARLLPPCSPVRSRPDELAECWRQRMASGPVVLHGGWSGEVLLGFVATSPIGEKLVELHALHVRPDWHGRGLAAWLHRAALAHAFGEGARELRLWVVDGNLRARRFYEKHGWRQAGGRRTVTIGNATLPAIDYARRL